MNLHPSMKKTFTQKLGRLILSTIFSLGFFSASVSQAQYTNVYWNPTNGLGGTGTNNSANTNWSLSSLGGGTLVPYQTVTIVSGVTNTNTSTNYIYNFSGPSGTVTINSSQTIGGINVLSTGYLWTSGAVRTFTATDTSIAAGQALSIASGANLTISGSGFAFDGLAVTGGSGATLTLSNNSATPTVARFGSSSATGGRTNSVNTIISGTGTNNIAISGTSIGVTQQGNISNNVSGAGVLVFSNGSSSSSGDIVVAGVISGAGPVSLVLNVTNGPNNIFLNASNSYSGGTTILNTNGGYIGIRDQNAFGSGTITIAGAGTNYIRNFASGFNVSNAIIINNGSMLRIATTNSGWKGTYSGVISGGGGIIMRFTDTQILTGTNNSFGGGINIASSTKVQVVSIGMAGSNSSLGTNGVVTFSSDTGGGAAGELYWLGANSEASDKNFALTTVSSSPSAGMKLYAGDNSSGGTNQTLTLNGNINSTGATNLTITLGAYNTNTLVVNGTINQTAGYTNSLVVGNSGFGTVVLGNINNSFGGAVTINAGSSSTSIVQVSAIGAPGNNSPLGTNGTINIGGSSGSGINILRYTGGGEETAKVINMSGTTGGATLDQSGTGNLKFTSTMTASGVGAKSLNLQGSTAGTGEISSVVGNFGGNVISIAKSGTGEWFLSGDNTYSGNTTITGGTLSMSGAYNGSGSVILSSTSSLLRLLRTNAMVNASLAGSSSTGTAGLVNLTVGGSYFMNSFGTTNNVGGYISFTNSSGSDATLTFTAPTNYMTLSSGGSGGRTITNQSANLTLIFNGALDIGSSTNADAGFAGPGNFTILGSVFNANTGVRNLQKSGAGTLTLSASNNYNGATTISAGALVLNAAGALGTNSMTLSGTLRTTVAGTNESKGNLTVTGNSTIDLGTNSAGVLRFATATNWTTGRILTVANSSGGAQLYILNTSGLDTTQIKSAENPTATASFDQNGLLTFSAGVVPPSGLSYTPTSVTGTEGTAITNLIPSVTGTVTSYSVSPTLPAGLSLNTSTGVISGTPSAVASSASYTVTASNSGGSTTASVTIVVNAVAPSGLSYTPTSVTGTVGTAISSLTPSVTGSVTGYSVSPALPAGLSLNTSTGVISGTPSAVASSASYTVTASNSGGSTTASVTIVVNAAGPTFDDAYPGKSLSEVAPNGLTYLMNYAFGGSDTTDPKLPVQDTTDPTKLALVAYVRTGDTSLSVSGEAAATLDFSSPSNAPYEVITPSDAPAGMEKRSYSVSVGGDRKFLRLKATKQ